MRTSTTALAAAALAVTVAACGGGDKTFDESGMTFSYPGDFKAGRAVGAKPSGRVIGIVGLDRDDYIAARGQRSAPLPVDQLRAHHGVADAQLGDRAGATVGQQHSRGAGEAVHAGMRAAPVRVDRPAERHR